ncbi:hypothetical protein HZQ32_17080 [Elizabethkingia anophelis]|nr:hypothetical protein [Elizabethkingia anophelis]
MKLNQFNEGDWNSPQLFGKSTKDLGIKQEKSELYSDLANQQAVKAEIGDVLAILDGIITSSLKEVFESQGEDPLKYKMTGMFATDLNATIKSKVFKRMDKDPIFNSKIQVRYNHTSPYFIVKDKYVVFIKKLNGKLNKPNSYPTQNSQKTFSGNLFVGKHIPFLFVGPNPKKGESSYVTSLVNRKEVNWTTETVDLFNYQHVELTNNNEIQVEINDLNNVTLNQDVIKKKKKSN